ncbi:glutathione S-transferase omega-1-like [Lineus longissimus]|uniref:glutathione S-transferase omega-1-like n=1 Tax=Lineus longissimus TaxID=88925 RepID=UPI002B4DD745
MIGLHTKTTSPIRRVSQHLRSRGFRVQSVAMGEKCYTRSSGAECPPLTKDKVRVYSMRFCPFAQRTRLVLAHKNIPNECINIHLRDKPTWFLEKYDYGTVPLIEINDKIIPESLVTCEYLDDVYPEPKLMPSDPYIKAKHNVLIQRYSKLISKYYKELRSKEGGDVFAELKYFEEELAAVKGDFIGGEKPLFVDFMIWPWCERFDLIPTFSEARETYPKFAAWVDAMKQIPAVQACMLSKDLHMGFYKTYPDNANYDYGL